MKRVQSLKEQILSDRNIYNAIYALESFVFEKGLLSVEDIKEYHHLTDKFDFKHIDSIIDNCKKKLVKILQPNELFDVEVYFKLKKYDESKGRFVFRPIHTASLEDQICMVCLLMPLMFEEQKRMRRLSELSKILPHNFYGNIPSTQVDELFVRWQRQYKTYSEDIIAKSKECKESLPNIKEVNLDLEDFFPSVNPAYIFHLVKERLKLVYNDEDLSTLEIVLTKLLYFHISKKNLEQWEEEYYPKGIPSVLSDFYTNRGIAQGLPQAYFFGNLMMLEVASLAGKEFPGESFYYVDDSVVFTDTVADKEDFVQRIKRLNGEFAEIEKITVSEKQADAYKHLSKEDRELQQALTYGVRYHEEGKSFFVELSDSYSGNGGLQYLTRQVSKAAAFSDNEDDIDDSMSKEKLDALTKVIDEELDREKLRLKNQDGRGDSQLKLLKRHKKFFLYRKRYLAIREEGSVTEEYLNGFRERFQLSALDISLERLQDTFDEEIFQTECRLIVNKSIEMQVRQFRLDVRNFERRLANKKGRARKFLYYSRDLAGVVRYKNQENVVYSSLIAIANCQLRSFATAKPEKQRKKIEEFLLSKNRKTWRDSFRVYAFFVLRSSDEFVRKICNTFFSTIFCIDVTDRPCFNKNNNRCLSYYELRILIFLRNRQFKYEAFISFIAEVMQSDVTMERMKTDSALMEVLHILISKVKNPLLVDNVILTHRLVSGLWKNGSKFLNAYTLHNEDHAIMLIRQCVRLLKVIDYISIKQNDYYVLFLACYLHDISMVIHPDLNDFKLGDTESERIVTKNILWVKKLPSDIYAYHKNFRDMLVDAFSDVYSYFENKKRNCHPKESADYIRQQHDKFLSHIDNAILEYVALISQSHGYDSEDVYGRKSDAKDSLFSVKYMMVLIRLADLMDMANDRVNYYRLRQNMESLSATSQFHWISHLITDGAYVTAAYDVNPNRSLTLQPITEHIKVKIFLNVAFMATYKKKKACEGCQAQHDIEVDVEYHCCNKTVIRILDKEARCNFHSKPGCPLICGWMMKKNSWLVKELQELRRYLNQVNSRLFDTEIEIDLICKDTYQLDNDMFDKVRYYLEQSE